MQSHRADPKLISHRTIFPPKDGGLGGWVALQGFADAGIFGLFWLLVNVNSWVRYVGVWLVQGPALDRWGRLDDSGLQTTHK